VGSQYVTRIETALASAGCEPIARVRESDRARDIAIRTSNSMSVVRCVPTPAPTDYHALATMVREGDFDRAVLVYCAEGEPSLSGEIESWPISRIEELAQRLAGERAP
jgi:hypothetical protein